jgi:hypothetical protein
MSATAHARERRLIDRHFAGRATPPLESALRTHLGGCDACREYYQHHLVLGQLDPGAPKPIERLATGLGFTQRPGRSRTIWPALGLAAAMAAVLLFARLRSPGDDDFEARGAVRPPAPALEVYRASGGATRPAERHVAADDELAFAYRNPGGRARLLVVGVDERGHTYWYHPDPDVTEAALPIERHEDAHELPEAIRHHYQGRSLRILGIFGDTSLSVAAVRRWLDASGCEGLHAKMVGIDCVTVTLDVEARP